MCSVSVCPFINQLCKYEEVFSVQCAAAKRPITTSLAKYALLMCVFVVSVSLCVSVCVSLSIYLCVNIKHRSVCSWDEAHYHFISQVCTSYMCLCVCMCFCFCVCMYMSVFVF